MEEKNLKNFETFEEMPDSLLLVNETSNLLYVRYGKDAFITREFFDNIIIDNYNVICTVSYYNVINNNKIFTLTIKKSLMHNAPEISDIGEDITIIPLNELLNVKGNNVIYIGLEDVEYITQFRGEEPVQKGKRIKYI